MSFTRKCFHSSYGTCVRDLCVHLDFPSRFIPSSPFKNPNPLNWTVKSFKGPRNSPQSSPSIPFSFLARFRYRRYTKEDLGPLCGSFSFFPAGQRANKAAFDKNFGVGPTPDKKFTTRFPTQKSITFFFFSPFLYTSISSPPLMVTFLRALFFRRANHSMKFFPPFKKAN